METLIKVFNLIYKLLTFILVLLIAAIAISVIPLPGNYRIYSVQSGSMEPAIHTGSIVFVKGQSDYGVGDIVTIRTQDPKATVTHRIAGIKTENGQISYELKGDANQTKDADPVLRQNVIGKVFFSIPLLGYPISYSQTLPGLVLLIIVPTTIIIYSEILTIKNEAIRLIKVRKHRKLTLAENIEKKVGEEIIEVEKDINKLFHHKTKK